MTDPAYTQTCNLFVGCVALQTHTYFSDRMLRGKTTNLPVICFKSNRGGASNEGKAVLESLRWETGPRAETQKNEEVGKASVDQSLTPLALAVSLQAN